MVRIKSRSFCQAAAGLLYRESPPAVASGMMMLWENPPSRGPAGALRLIPGTELASRRLAATGCSSCFGCLSLRLAPAADAPVEKTKDPPPTPPPPVSNATTTEAQDEEGRPQQCRSSPIRPSSANPPTARWIASTAMRASTPKASRTVSPLTPVNCASCHDDVGRRHAFTRDWPVTGLPAGEDTTCYYLPRHPRRGAREIGRIPFRPRPADGLVRPLPSAAHDQFLASAHGHALAAGMAEAPACLDCHRLPVARRPEDKLQIERKLAQTNLCESCHLKKSEVGARTLMGSKFVSSFDKSVHGAALQRGLVDAANCVDCHGSHEMNQAMVAGSRVQTRPIPETCARCHKSQTAEYNFSVHAVALRRGNLDSPVCTDCHGEHDILAHTNPDAPVYARNVAQEVCASCHASGRVAKKYGMATDAVQTFSDSYHGLAARGGAARWSIAPAATVRTRSNPTSIRPPRSTRPILASPAASATPAQPAVHRRPGPRQPRPAHESPILYWIANLYVVLIFLVIGGMTLHNLSISSGSCSTSSPSKGRDPRGTGAAPPASAHDRPRAPAARRAGPQFHPAGPDRLHAALSRGVVGGRHPHREQQRVRRAGAPAPAGGRGAHRRGSVARSAISPSRRKAGGCSSTCCRAGAM
jgi:hypothetical protein